MVSHLSRKFNGIWYTTAFLFPFGMLEDFDFHSLRHTHATELVDAGAKPEFVQHRLGHKKIEITMNTYYHLTDETRRKQADEINMF